jgi:hypothetical protein
MLFIVVKTGGGFFLSSAQNLPQFRNGATLWARATLTEAKQQAESMAFEMLSHHLATLP